MIYGYIRVSTDKQDCENQKLGIESKASALGLCIDKCIKDAGISGVYYFFSNTTTCEWFVYFFWVS